MIATFTKALYKIGDVVPEDGLYLCVPCSFVQEFKAGDLFTTCIACYAGTSMGPEDYTDEHVDFWEKFV
jgi:hypothetical protein